MKILVLSTWFPYPLAQGSKIRAYYLLRALAAKHKVVLCSFEDMPLQPEWLAHMRGFCQRVETVARNPFDYSRRKRMLGWLSLEPSAVKAGYSPEMKRCVQQVYQEERPDVVLALTFVTTPYALDLPSIPKIVDVDNFLSRFFYEDFRKAVSFLSKARRWLAWKKFERYEKKIFRKADACLVVSEQDRAALQQSFGIPGEAVRVIPNGVDIQRNIPGLGHPKTNQLVFNGSVTYQANLDAVAYFLSEIFPLIRGEVPEVRLIITGRTDGIDLQRLPNLDRVTFTGYLDDVRQTISESWACVVPLRIGAGTRLKILEAMALGTPVITTIKGMEGLSVNEGRDILVGDTPQAFARHTIRLLSDPRLREEISTQGARSVREQYDWETIGQRLVTLTEEIKEREGSTR